jgi:hypothetical protein
MTNHIDFITFKQILNDKNILLFDGQYRIAHFRFNSLLKNMDQNGGGYIAANINSANPTLNTSSNPNPNPNPNNKLNHFSEKLINNRLFNKLIDTLLENNFERINYIINLINN